MNSMRQNSGNVGMTDRERLERRRQAGKYIWPQLEQRAADEQKPVTVVRTPERTMHEHRERLATLKKKRTQ